MQPTYFAIVPYTLQGTHPIGFKELSKQYPACTEYLLENKESIKGIGKQSRIYAEEVHDYIKIAKSYVEIWEKN